MGFLDKLFLSRKPKDPLSALALAIFTATHRVTEKLRPLGGIEGTEIKREDFPRYEMLFSELLYFYMTITLRLAHGKGFTPSETRTLQESLFPVIIEGTVEGPIGHWPEKDKDAIKADHYDNVNSAGLEYAPCKGIYPTDDPLAEGNSVYATLARNIEKRLGLAHDPKLSHAIIFQVSDQLRALQFPRLLADVRKICS